MTNDYRLFEDDCLTILPELANEDVKVDLVLTDPPYLMNYCSGWIKDKNHDFTTPIANDNNKEVITSTIKYLNDILINGGGILMFCNSNHVDFFKQELEKYFSIKNVLIWVKNNWSAGDLKGAFAKQTEFIIYATKGRRLLYGGRDSDVLYFDRIKRSVQQHQNQKPVDLLEYLLSKCSDKGQLVLDCFMGSGSTGVACANTGRGFIGIELEPKYYKIASERIKEAYSQTRLDIND